MNYEQSVDYIVSVRHLGSRPGLERISRLCALMGNPQDAVRTIHVTGTNGKGSFCAMSESVLRAAGYKTGLFTSPHLRRYNESMKICGEDISDKDFAAAASFVRSFADSMDDSPTEFELLTAMAFECFRRQACDIAIIEVCMGGAADSTNVISSPLLSVITGVSLDHTAMLGDTVERIAAVKAGIIKPGCPVLWCGGDTPARAVITEHATAIGSEFLSVDYSQLSDIRPSLLGCDFDYGGFEDLHLDLIGIYQPKNAAAVISALPILHSAGFDIPPEAVYRGLADVRWHARFELLLREPVVIYDGSHNPEAVAAAVSCIETLLPGGRVNILSGVMRDKDYRTIASLLAGTARRVFTVTPNNSRALPAKEYAACFPPLGIDAEAYPKVADGVAAAYFDTLSSGVPLIIIGSFYLYAEVCDALAACRGGRLPLL